MNCMKVIACALVPIVLVSPVFGSPAMTTANVNMRSGPGTSFGVLQTIPQGQKVDLQDCDESGAWCSVTFSAQNGFVSGQYLQETEDQEGWPRSYATDAGGRVILYQPQITDWEDFQTIKALIAAEYVKPNETTPVFGVIGVSGKTYTDSSTNEVVINELQVTEINFSALDRTSLADLSVEVGGLMPTGSINISVDRITANLAQYKQVQDVEGLKADAPPIFVSEAPAILVQTNGEATLAPVQGVEGLSFILNTNWDVLKIEGDDNYYLRDEEAWISATALDGDWQAATSLPPSFSNLPDDDSWKDAKAAIPPKPFEDGKTPKVFYTDTPAELIVFDGEAKRVPVEGTSLEWYSNTESDLFYDSAQDQYYVLVSGRWFRAAALEGPWTFASTDLPSDFLKIPPDAPYYSVLSSVPGTSEAAEARLKASIPHTARVEVGSVAADVSYGGDPQFEPIEGTELSYAVNTDDQVIQVGDKYYVLQDGVWFVGDSPEGPFVVAEAVPEEIYTIPPSSPVYNVTYVRVYETQPGAVWFGYTMGYLTGYLAWGTIVYGTGWRYRPPLYYYGPGRYPVYYQRPVTYGMGAYYNPVYGAYGRYGYAYGPYRGIGGGAVYNPNTGGYIRGGYATGPRGNAGFVSAYNPRTGNSGTVAWANGNVYKSWDSNGVKTGNQWAGTNNGQLGGQGGGRWNSSGGAQTLESTGRRGNVFAGNDGNVYRNNGDKWEKNTGNGWANVDRPSNDTLKRPGGGDGAAGLNRPGQGDGGSGLKRPGGGDGAVGNNRPAASKPAQNKPAASRPAQNKPAASRPAQKKPAATKPAQKRPAANTRPATKQPTQKRQQTRQTTRQAAPSHLSRDSQARNRGNQQRNQQRTTQRRSSSSGGGGGHRRSGGGGGRRR